MTKEKYMYNYTYTEYSQDERTWTIDSEVQLTEEGVKEIAQGSSMSDNYTKTGGATGGRYKLTFNGILYTDECYSKVRGDLVDEMFWV